MATKTSRTITFIALVSAWLIISTQLGSQATKLESPAAPAVTEVNDFVVYWAATRLLLAGKNPYSPDEIGPLEQSVGSTLNEPMLFSNPPWSIFFLMPFGLLGYSLSQLVWLTLHFAILLFSADWSWRFYGGPVRRYWIAWVIAVTFLPALICLGIGQIGPLILLGIVAFLYCEQREQWSLAGASLVLIAIKPHLLYLFWVALLLWFWERRIWFLLLGGMVATSIATIIPMLFNYALVLQYFNLNYTANQAPLHWKSPTFGVLLRMLSRTQKFWVQFIPSLLVTLWFVTYYWQRNKQAWNWSQQMPMLLLISLSTTFYAWPFDLVVLLPAVIQVGVWTSKARSRIDASLATAIHLGINGAALALTILHVKFFWYIWLAPTLLLAYFCLRWKIKGPQAKFNKN